jgi:cytochrome P450
MTQGSIASAQTAPEGVPIFDVNLHDDQILLDPYPTYTALREAGPVVRMSHYGYYAFARYGEVSSTLADWETFTSGEGVGFNHLINSLRETSLMNEGDFHDEIRQVEGCPIKKGPLEELKPRLNQFSDDLIAELRNKSQIDGIADIAMRMPIDVVTDLVGIAEAGRAQYFEWGKAGFDSLGPLDAPRTEPALQTMQGYFQYAAENFPNNIREGGWADQLFKNGAKAGWTEEFCRGVMNDYVFPSIDSTVSAIGSGLLLFAQNPDQWALLRKDRSLITSAIPEIIRVASPLQFFTRVATTDTAVGGVDIPAGSRIIVMYASANRDHRQFPDPERFDITRDPTEHLGWGRGKHSCLGKPLARLEMITLFSALADHVESFHVGSYRYEPNNIVRSLGELELAINWAD